MQENLTMLNFGISTVESVPDWLEVMNSASPIDRVYYVLEEGAGYILNVEKHKFIKNHIYILSHTLKLTYFLDDPHFYHAFITYNNVLSPQLDDVIDIDLEDSPILKADMDAFFAYMADKPNHPIHRVGTPELFFEHYERIMLILKSILHDLGQDMFMHELKDMLISQSLSYIHAHFSEDISVTELANQVNLSKNQYTRRFQAQLGISPYQYIKRYRFGMAISMLNAGTPVNDVAEKCGFLSASAFSNSFKKNFGYSPTKISL